MITLAREERGDTDHVSNFRQALVSRKVDVGRSLGLFTTWEPKYWELSDRLGSNLCLKSKCIGMKFIIKLKEPECNRVARKKTWWDPKNMNASQER